MKKLLLFCLLALTSCSSQTRTFTYNWQIADGTLIINFANYRGNSEYGTSRDGKGLFKTKCQQTYLDFRDILFKHGNPDNSEEVYYHIEKLEIYTNVDGYMLMIDNFGRVWKLDKPHALILASQLDNQLWIAMMLTCPDVQCCLIKNQKL